LLAFHGLKLYSDFVERTSELTAIWKYPLKMVDLQTVEMPRGAIPLSVALQPSPDYKDQPSHDDVCLWALVDPTADKVERQIGILGTGHEASQGALEGSRFVGTVLQFNGRLVLHVFVAAEPSNVAEERINGSERYLDWNEPPDALESETPE
jgi:hypothetical protein